MPRGFGGNCCNFWKKTKVFIGPGTEVNQLPVDQLMCLGLRAPYESKP